VSTLDGRLALVCGGSAGIGLASAQALAAAGARVRLLARTEATLRAALATLPGHGHGFIVADAAQPESLARHVHAALGDEPVAVLVNNSAGPPPGAIANATAAQFLDTLQQQLLAAHGLAQHLLPGMRAQGFGRIINIISTSVREPIPNLGVSNTVRAAVAAWAKTLASEVAADGITVNSVLPGFTKTARLAQILENRVRATGRTLDEVEAEFLSVVPAGRFAEPAEVAAAVAFYASPAAGYITGTTLAVDGGRTKAL
jgi:3-oxoacyl-[acyl-carrier protein] reductase